jgi:hypothetical protein
MLDSWALVLFQIHDYLCSSVSFLQILDRRRDLTQPVAPVLGLFGKFEREMMMLLIQNGSGLPKACYDILYLSNRYGIYLIWSR